jgi:hypothetical protein
MPCTVTESINLRVEMYKGEWYLNTQNGKGVLYKSNGSKQDGTWVKDHLLFLQKIKLSNWQVKWVLL